MNSYDQLPPDVKLYMFSFLKPKEMVAATSVNRLNRKLDHEEKLWRQRVQQDFGMLVPSDTNAKAFYIALHEQLNEESRISSLLTILHACWTSNDNPVRNLVDPPEFNSEQYNNEMIHLMRTLIIGSRKTIIHQAESVILRFLVKPDCEINFSYFHRMFANQDYNEILQDENLLINEIYMFSDYNAKLHLHNLIRIAPKEMLSRIICNPEHGSALFFKALRFGNVDMIKTLLEFGLDTNHIQKKHRSSCYYRPLDSVLFDLQTCTALMAALIIKAENQGVIDETRSSAELYQYYLYRINCFKEILNSLLVYGADPDSLSSDGLVTRVSPRAHALACLNQALNKEDTWYPDEIPTQAVPIIDKMLEEAQLILKSFVDRPKNENTAGQESENKRARFNR